MFSFHNSEYRVRCKEAIALLFLARFGCVYLHITYWMLKSKNFKELKHMAEEMHHYCQYYYVDCEKSTYLPQLSTTVATAILLQHARVGPLDH